MDLGSSVQKTLARILRNTTGGGLREAIRGNHRQLTGRSTALLEPMILLSFVNEMQPNHANVAPVL